MEVPTYKIFILIILNIALQMAAFCLIKFAWIYAHHSIYHIVNIITVLAFSVTFLRAFLWQHLLKINDLMSSYLPSALLPSLLLLAGYFIFNEHVTRNNLIGTLMIMLGLIMLFKNKAKI